MKTFKEFIGEEGYDHMRDRALERGTWKSNPKKSDATTRPVSKDIKNQKGKTVLQKQSEKNLKIKLEISFTLHRHSVLISL